MPSTQTDEIYYRDAGSVTFARRVSLIARSQVYKAFIVHFKPGPTTTIIDIGASDHDSDEANALSAGHHVRDDRRRDLQVHLSESQVAIHRARRTTTVRGSLLQHRLLERRA
jgi:hypothetical protein